MRLAFALCLVATPINAITHGFCWVGAEDYRIEGTISYPDGATGILREFELTGFTIKGFKGDTYLGRWSLAEAEGDDPIQIRFDADALAFPMGGDPLAGTYQAWNAGGAVTDCGTPGFGFNGGNRAQDVCVDGLFIDESGVPPDTPLKIAENPSNPCGPMLLGALPRRNTPG